MKRPLNPELYDKLRVRFGKVLISKEGERARTIAKPDMFTGKLKYKDLASGEEYRVCCPVCGDRRYRLFINYRWGTQCDVPTKYLVHCFNEDCNVTNLEDELKPYIGGKTHSLPSLGFEPIPEMKEITLPEKCVPLNTLPKTHPAIKYITERRFTADYLYNDWGVQYCGDHPSYLVSHRLVIPFYWDGKLIGWQARTLVPNVTPKYYTMPGLPKSQMLFNGDRAKKFKMGVIVEGVFDAFRVGHRAVALLGTSISSIQRQLIHSYWNSGCVCLMLDSDAVDKMQKATNLFSPTAFKSGIFSVILPDGKDPADMTRKELEEAIAKHAAACRIPISG
jgi:hypothetical protein